MWRCYAFLTFLFFIFSLTKVTIFNYLYKLFI